MTGLARVALFAAALAAVFAGAAAVGRAVGPLEREVGSEQHASEAAAHPVGLSLDANGFRLALARTSFRAGENAVFEFRVHGAARYDVVHTRRMHLIVARRDLTNFQHLHPTYRNGVWTARVRFAEPGPYRVFADFSAGGKRTVHGHDVFVPGRWSPQPLRAAKRAPTTDGYVVTNRGVDKLAFRVERNGLEVRPDPYLGARGHLVVLRAGDLAYVHAHPDENTLAFETDLPAGGAYRAFLQFKHAGRVRTVSFVLQGGV